MEMRKRVISLAISLALAVSCVSALHLRAYGEELTDSAQAPCETQTLPEQTAYPPLDAAPGEPEQTDTVLTVELPFQVNPLYEGLLDESDFALPEPDMPPICMLSDYGTEADAVLQLREQLTQRVEYITVLVESQRDPGEMLTDLFTRALAHTGVPTQGDYLAWQYGGYKSGYDYSISGETYYCQMRYQVVYYTTAEQEAQMDAAVADLLGRLSLDGKTKYEKIQAIYDYICSHTVYDYDTLNDDSYKLKYTAYAALINETSVCQGYATLLYRLALESGVDCRLIAGIGNGGGHGWNIVLMDDGVYYNVDATWDAVWRPYGYRYFLRCDDTFEDHARYAQYASAEFCSAYPMGQKDYVPDSEPPADPVRGDFDHDGTVTVQDAVTLLRMVLLSESLPDVKDADLNGDGAVNEADAIRIVTHLLFPEVYPLCEGQGSSD